MADDPMADIRASFFVECEELLESLLDALSAIADDGGRGEDINTAFRAVHSIKGGAAAFALNPLVAFSHQFEGALDGLRTGRSGVTTDTLRLFVRATDLLQDHIEAAHANATPPIDEGDLFGQLRAISAEPAMDANPAPAFTPLPLRLDLANVSPSDALLAPPISCPEHDSNHDGQQTWQIRLAPQDGLYQSGNETVLLLRALQSLGSTRTECNIPVDLGLDEGVAENARLAWDIWLTGDVERHEIEEIFDFVTDVCEISIEPALNPGIVDNPINERPDDPAPADTPPPSERSAHPGPITPAPPYPDNAAAGRQPDKVTVRVPLAKIDELINLIGELVINQAMLSQRVERAGLADGDVNASLEDFMSLTRDIQDGIMSVRAQPVKPLFQRMARIVREASAMTGKAIRLTTEGEATEVDRIIIERLADPLTHMIRNAIDHGVEADDVRRRAGKPAEGLIRLSAAHSAGRVLIRVTDDGAGIDRAAVRQRAIQRDLIAPDAIPADSEIDQLIFQPGFSTAPEVSALSGRGVGMDVVREAISGLGGRVSVSSTPGEGASFLISLPLTLAVVDGMVVRAGGQTFIVPLSAIIETTALRADAIKPITANACAFQFRGSMVPVIDLGAHFGFPNGHSASNSRVVLLTAREDGSQMALIIDRILEQRQVVIKGLDPLLGRIPGVAAATILGNGRIALILDPADLAANPGDPAGPPMSGASVLLAG